MSIEDVSLGMCTRAGSTPGTYVYIHSLLHRLGVYIGNHKSTAFRIIELRVIEWGKWNLNTKIIPL